MNVILRERHNSIFIYNNKYSSLGLTQFGFCISIAKHHKKLPLMVIKYLGSMFGSMAGYLSVVCILKHNTYEHSLSGLELNSFSYGWLRWSKCENQS